MNLDHIHEFEHPSVTIIRDAVNIGVAKQTRDVGMVFLDDFLTVVIPEFEAFDLLDGIGGRARPTSVLRVWVMMQWKRILVIDGQRPAGELEARASCHAVERFESLEMGKIRRNAIVFGAGSELDVFGQQIQHSTELAGGVIAGRRRMAVQIAAHPTSRIDGPFQHGFDGCFIAAFCRDLPGDRVVLIAVADQDVVIPRRQGVAEIAVLGVDQIVDLPRVRVGTKIGIAILDR